MGETISLARAIMTFAGRGAVTAVAFVAVGALLEGFGVLLLVPLVATLFGGHTAGLSGWLPQVSELTAILALFGAVMTVRAFVLWRRDAILGALQIAFVEAQRARLARGLAAASWPALARLGHGRVTHLMGGDIQRCGVGVAFLFQSGVAAAMIIAQVSAAVVLAPVPAILALTVIAIGATALSMLVRRAHDAGALHTAAQLAVMTGIGRFLTGMKLALSQNLQASFVAAFERDLEQAARAQSAFMAQQGLMRGLWSLLGAGVAGATLMLGHGVFALPAPVLLALLVLLARIGGPAAQIHNGVQQIAYSLPAWRAVRIIEFELATAAAPARTGGVAPQGSIVFEDVGYRHEDNAGVSALTLRIEPGEIVGVTGVSGAGKTTFADLLTGLLAPQTGRIRIGGTPLDARNIAGWRERIAYVAQDPVLFNQTVRDNLLWANPAAGNADISAALEIAGARALVGRLSEGLDTILGETGSRLSGGERQRIALARALLRAPDLLLLDEATNAIDVEGEATLLARLRALAPRPAIVVIAHRTETLAACDRVLTFEGGKIVTDVRAGVRCERLRA